MLHRCKYIEMIQKIENSIIQICKYLIILIYLYKNKYLYLIKFFIVYW